MPRSTSYNEAFSSDIFNQKPPKSTKISIKRVHGPSFQETASDVFPSQQPNYVTASNSPPRRGKKTFNPPTDSVTFDNYSKRIKYFKPSDGNPSNRSSIFDHWKEKSTAVKKKHRSSSQYNPDPYYNKDSAVEKYAKEFYTTKTIDIKGPTKRGYYKRGEDEKNDLEALPYDTNPIKKKCEWGYLNSANIEGTIDVDQITENPPNNKKFCNRIREMQSNIFNDPNKSTEIQTYDLPIYQESFEPDPWAAKKNKTKWPRTKQKWDDNDNEKIFKKFDDKKAEKLTPLQRKQNNLNRSQCDENGNSIPVSSSRITKKDIKYNVNDNRRDIKRISGIINITTPSIKKDKERKYIENVSSVGFDKDFYLRNVNRSQEKDREHEFEVVAKNNSIDNIQLKKILYKEGIHAYDMTPANDVSNSKIKFKVRENNQSSFNDQISRVQNKLKEDNGATLNPVNKINVNRKRHENHEIWGTNQVYPDQENTKCNNIRIKKGVRREEKLSKQFINVNNRYKNNIVHSSYKK